MASHLSINSGSSTSSSSSSSSSAHASFRLLSPRTWTFLLALLGLLTHIHTYSWLGTLRQSLPDVPERPYSVAPVRLDPYGVETGAAAGTNLGRQDLPQWVREAKAYLRAQGLDALGSSSEQASVVLIGTNRIAPPEGAPSVAAAAAAGASSAAAAAAAAAAATSAASSVHSSLAFDFSTTATTTATSPSSSSSLPLSWFAVPRPASPPNPPSYNLAPHDDLSGFTLERSSMLSVRLLIGTFRLYILLSILFCLCGLVGVVRLHLLLSRLFLFHSFLDLFFSTMSVLAMGVLCTYPSIRRWVCEEYGGGGASGVAAFFAPLSTTGAEMSLRAAEHRAHLTPDPSDPAAPIGSPGQTDLDPTPSNLDTLLDNIFGSENCEDSFRSTLVPLLLVLGLVYTAARIYAFVQVQRYYVVLLRSRGGKYGGRAKAGAWDGGEAGEGSRERERERERDKEREREWISRSKEEKLLD